MAEWLQVVRVHVLRPLERRGGSEHDAERGELSALDDGLAARRRHCRAWSVAQPTSAAPATSAHRSLAHL